MIFSFTITFDNNSTRIGNYKELTSLANSDFTMKLVCVVFCIFWLSVHIQCNWIENKGLWYYISDEETLNYQQATAKCESMNSRLADITNADQNDFINRNMNRGTKLWIGLSNNKTADYSQNCKDNDYVWNYDRDCEITYTNGYSPPKTENCMGVLIRKKWLLGNEWTSDRCEDEFGFVCQWECKRFYIQFETLDLYSGIYGLEYYWKEHIVYTKMDIEETLKIYKPNRLWVLSKGHGWNDKDKVANFKSDLYVPYHESMSWKTSNNNPIETGSWCVECDQLFLSLSYSSETIYSEQLQLDLHIQKYPVYNNRACSPVITYSDTQFSTCVNVPSIDSNICEYIFPYPDQETIIEADNNHMVNIQNMCISPIHKPVTIPWDCPLQTSQSSTEQTTSVFETSTPEATNDSSAELENPEDNTVIIIAISLGMITISIVIALVTFLFVRRKRKSGETEEDKHNLQNIHNYQNDNVNMEYNNDAVLNKFDIHMTNKDNTEVTLIGGEYSYADVPVQGPKQAAPGLLTPKMLQQEVVHGVTDANKAPIEGFLAQDYGELMLHNRPHSKGGNMDHATCGINAVYSEISKPEIGSVRLTNSPTTTKLQNQTCSNVSPYSMNKFKSNSDDDLELHENEVYVYTPECNQQNNRESTNVYYNQLGTGAYHGLNAQIVASSLPAAECGYYNIGGGTNEDDLEISENSAYEQ